MKIRKRKLGKRKYLPLIGKKYKEGKQEKEYNTAGKNNEMNFKKINANRKAGGWNKIKKWKKLRKICS